MARKVKHGYGTAVSWFVAGGAVGTCAALLFAPRSGKETRAQLAERARETKASVADLTADLAEKAGQLRDGATRLAERAFSKGHEVVDSIDEYAAHAADGR